MSDGNGELARSLYSRGHAAIRAVDELNAPLVASRASDTEPAPPPFAAVLPGHLVCRGCAAELRAEMQLKTREAQCKRCGETAPCDRIWALPEPAAEEPTSPIGPTAGIVRIPGEELFEAIESEEDIVRANRELLEGTPQTTEQQEQWRRLYGEIMNEANKRLRGRQVMLLVAVPNPNGLGCVFTGLDLPRFEAAKNSGIFLPGGEDYEVVLTLPAAERVDLRKAGREEFVCKFIGIVCDAVLEQKAAYEQRVAH